MDVMLGADFWIGLFKIVWINIILSGDNAVVIALAARSLPPAQQKKAVMLGSGAAVVLRIALTVVAAKLMQLPFVEVIGGLLLLWIGVGLLKGEDEAEDSGSVARQGMMAAVRTILLADLVMSLDNVIAVAAAAGGNMLLLILGLAISIPLVIFGSTLMIRLMERFPVIVTLGAALIGWVAGETITSDHVLEAFVLTHPWAHYTAAACGAVLVIAVGRWMQPGKADAPGRTA
ncbi:MULTISPECIES: TerC family protein [Comamonas]|uniref:TerC family protein n=1 Tax=Comamonas TaxID=283 RepID=UPI0012C35EB5|nr:MULTISPECIES: TerC family protein [Comamonas]MDR3067248.1 TerC family protein [Comamonas sp.]MEB5966199.1 TerC family protein [Comamonas testosteroni]MPS94352.1 TerC family protein [Comamonas sp.]